MGEVASKSRFEVSWTGAGPAAGGGGAATAAGGDGVGVRPRPVGDRVGTGVGSAAGGTAAKSWKWPVMPTGARYTCRVPSGDHAGCAAGTPATTTCRGPRELPSNAATSSDVFCPPYEQIMASFFSSGESAGSLQWSSGAVSGSGAAL